MIIIGSGFNGVLNKYYKLHPSEKQGEPRDKTRSECSSVGGGWNSTNIAREPLSVTMKNINSMDTNRFSSRS
jgi:hypothetical protein